MRLCGLRRFVKALDLRVERATSVGRSGHIALAVGHLQLG